MEEIERWDPDSGDITQPCGNLNCLFKGSGMDKKSNNGILSMVISFSFSF